jgi:integrase
MNPAATQNPQLAGPEASSRAPGDRAAVQTSAQPTLAQLVDAYMRAYIGRDDRNRASTLRAWRALLGSRLAFEISDDDVFGGLEQLRAQPARVHVGRDALGRRLHIEKGPRSIATINRYHAALMAVFTWSIKQRLAPRGFENPARKIERTPEKNAVVRFLADTERERLFEACRESTWPRLYLLVLMALTTGARRGELLGLTWGDVDLERAIAHVKTTKNDHPRALPLLPAVLAELRRFASARPEACVFPSRSRLTAPRHFESSWLAAVKRAGIRRFRFHDLRHSCASYLAQNGASLLEIADVMGHRQLAMVKRYAHLTTDSKAKLVNRVLGGIK